MDAVRRRLLALVKREGASLAEVSRAIGRNHAYLQQFVHRGTPKSLPEEARRALAGYFGVDESDLRPPHSVSGDPAAGKSAPGGRPVPKSFAARLAVARAESVFETPSSFAEAAGIDRLRYADLEDGEDSPTLDELDRVARCSGKSLDWLIRGEVSQPAGSQGWDSLSGSGIRLFDTPPNAPRRRKRRDSPSS